MAAAPPPVRRLGLVVHPARDVVEPVETVRAWAAGDPPVELLELWPYGADRAAGRPALAEGCDVVLAIGGDGTLLAALHAGADERIPVLGVSWGSLAALGVVAEADLDGALQRLAAGDYGVRELLALSVEDADATMVEAFNDVVVARNAGGQVSLATSVDGELYARIAGDGLVVSTPLGSTAYGLAAGGPILAPDTHAFVATALASHGGCCPPLVLDRARSLEVEWVHGHDQCRIEVDGRPSTLRPPRLRVVEAHRPARLVTLGGDPFPRPLRRRRIVLDSPRVAVLAGQPSPPRL
jgi:NAD+ kinase